MSLLFFKKSLLNAKEAIEKGDWKKAEEILELHYRSTGQDEKQERKKFNALIQVTESYIDSINSSYGWVEKKNKKNALYAIKNAIEDGRKVIFYAEKVTKLCKKEELDLK